MKIKYQEFLSKYEASGLSKRAFGIREGMSSSMVSYYLKRAKQEHNSEDFVKLNAPNSRMSIAKEGSVHIWIRTASGLEIQIPI